MDPEKAAMTPELARLVRIWPELPAAIRAGIMAMVDVAQSGGR